MAAMGGAHRHVASAPDPAVRGRRVLAAAVALLILSTLTGLVLLRPTGAQQEDVPESGERVRGTVTAAETAPCSGASPEAPDGADPELCVELDVRIDEGPDTGQVVQQAGGDNATGRLGPGDGVVLAADPSATGVQDRYQLTDSQRGRSLTALAVLFALAVVALGRLRGLLALLGLGLSSVILVGWLVPALLSGRPPVLTATVGASAVMLSVLLLAHGPSIRTATAIVGTQPACCSPSPWRWPSWSSARSPA
jgi:hypothetical protein